MDKKSIKGNVFSIKKFAVHDGPGIRTTIFFSGCPLNCIWCHNPESRYNIFSNDENDLISITELIKKVERDSIFYDESDGGVTISGGEPLVQKEFLINLLKTLTKRKIHTVLDTTGFSTTAVFKDVAKFVDLFLYDLKIMNNKKHFKYTGVSNSEIHENFEYLTTIDKNVWVRFPMIPGITDDTENIRSIGSFIRNRKNIQRISVLPYHPLAGHKYKKLNKEWEMGELKTPDKEEIERVCSIFEEYGLKTYIGG